jgi:putative oxidoreductase
MNPFFGRSNMTYALMRMSFGVLFACHGAQKLFGVLGGNQADNTLMWVAGVIEFAGGLLIAGGFFTSIAAFLCTAHMLVAYSTHLDGGLIPAQNNGELALLYAFVFLYIATKGSGIWSLDKNP